MVNFQLTINPNISDSFPFRGSQRKYSIILVVKERIHHFCDALNNHTRNGWNVTLVRIRKIFENTIWRDYLFMFWFDLNWLYVQCGECCVHDDSRIATLLRERRLTFDTRNKLPDLPSTRWNFFLLFGYTTHTHTCDTRLCFTWMDCRRPTLIHAMVRT